MLAAFSAYTWIFSIANIECWLYTMSINCDIHILVAAKLFVVIDNAEGSHYPYAQFILVSLLSSVILANIIY